jgi:hypothetical protein
MIVTVTLNPADDVTYKVAPMNPGDEHRGQPRAQASTSRRPSPNSGNPWSPPAWPTRSSRTTPRS